MAKSSASLFQPTDEWLTRRVVLIGIFIAIAAFYVLTLPANHSEAVDGYDYAHRAEALAITNIDDTRSILFTFINKLLYQASQLLGLGLRAMPVLIAFEVLTAAGSVLLMARLLQKGFGLSRVASWSGAAFLGVSYGFWRYAGEVEVYVPSIFLILATLNLLFDALDEAEDGQPRWAAVIPAAVLAGLSGLYYQPNVIPLFLAVPALMLSRKRLGSFIVYGAVGSAVILGGFVAAYLVHTQDPLSARSLLSFATNREDEFRTYPLTFKTLLAMAQAILHNILSTNWMFGIDAITHSLHNLYPDRSIAPKIFAAEHFRPFLYASIPLLALLLGLLTWIASLAIWNRRQWTFDRRILFCVVWLALLFFIIGYLDPTSREPWIMALPPLVILFAVYGFEPVARMGKGITLAVFLSTMLLYNFFGGMGIIQSQAGNFQDARTVWLKDNASPNDAIIFGEQSNDRRMKIYLAYVHGLKVYTYPPSKKMTVQNEDISQSQFLESVSTHLRARNGRLFVLSEFFVDDWTLISAGWKDDKRVARARSFMDRIRRDARLVDKRPLGAIFEVNLKDVKSTSSSNQ
jgi:hypothetical protein